MSFRKPPAPPTEPVPIQPEGLSTNQQTVPVPLWWGTRKIAVRWITGIKSQWAVEAQTARPGKKG